MMTLKNESNQSIIRVLWVMRRKEEYEQKESVDEEELKEEHADEDTACGFDSEPDDIQDEDQELELIY